MIKRMIKGCPTESDAKASKRVQRRVVNPMAAVDVVAPGREADNCLHHQPVRDRDNAQQRGRVETPAVASAPRLALKTSLWGSRGGDVGCDQARRNVRSYGKEAFAPEDLDRILEAARRTPAVGNQPTSAIR
jgi:hypothetical protein